MVKAILLKNVKKGEFFTLRDIENDVQTTKVYVKRDYDRASKKYSCTRYSDFNDEKFLSGDKIVYVGFTF